MRALLSRSLVAKLLGIARQLVVLPLLAPGQLGLFRFTTTIASYSRFAEVGHIATLHVRMPEHLASGDSARVAAYQERARRQILLGAALFMPVALLLLSGTGLPWPILTLVALACGIPLLNSFVLASFYARGRFVEVARMQMWAAVVGFVCLVGAAVAAGVVGVILAFFVPALIVVVGGREFLRAQRTALENAPPSEFWFGVRMWAAGSAQELALTGDILLMGFLLGERSPTLGLYAFALMIPGLIGRDLKAFNIVQQREIQLAVGRLGTVRRSEIVAMLERYAKADIILASVLGLAALAATPLLALAFPSYEGGVSAIGILLLAATAERASSYPSAVLSLADRAGLRIVAAVTQAVVIGIGVVVSVQNDWGLLGFASSRAAAVVLAVAVQLGCALAVAGFIRRLASLVPSLLLLLVPLALAAALTAAALVPAPVACLLGVAGLVLVALTVAPADFRYLRQTLAGILILRFKKQAGWPEEPL